MDPTNTPTPTPTAVWFTPTPYPVETIEPGTNIDVEVAYLNFYTLAEHGVQMYQTANRQGGIDLLLWVPIMWFCFVGFKNIRKRVKAL